MTNEAVANPEQVSPSPDQNSQEPLVSQDASQDVSQDVSHDASQNDKEKNFANLRETKERLEQENKQMRAYLEAVKQENEKQIEAQKKQQEFEDDDDFVNKRDLRSLAKKVENLQKVQKENADRLVPERLKQRFSDFDNVFTESNLHKLSTKEPELFETLKNSKDPYNAGVAAYKSVKKILSEDKPRSVQSIAGQGGLSDANAFANPLTEEGMKRLSEHAFKYAGRDQT